MIWSRKSEGQLSIKIVHFELSSLVFAGKLFPFAAAPGCQDKRIRKAGKSIKASQGGDSNVEHRIHVYGC